MISYARWLLKNQSQVPSVKELQQHLVDSDAGDRPSRASRDEEAGVFQATSIASRSSSASSARTLVDVYDPLKMGPVPSEALELESQGSAEVIPETHVSIPELYYQCQNLSLYPSAPPLARRFLLHVFSTLFNPETRAELEADQDSIFSLSSDFDDEELEVWLKRQYRQTTDKFEAYLARRKAGGSKEMFADKEDASRWCRESAVVKYVDGAWLHSTYQSNVGLEVSATQQSYSVAAARRAARVSWQVLSEELGDGDIEKEHCAVYERLMDSLAGKRSPKADDDDFTDWNRDADGEIVNKQPYVAAMLQLAMSISPNEFLPEILGFNLSYEGLPYHLLVTAKELRELKIDPYYFVLHISIDNSHSGHSAMARQAVSDFLDSSRAKHGNDAANALWRRVQAGFALADTIRTTPKTHKELQSDDRTTPQFYIDIPLEAPSKDQGQDASAKPSDLASTQEQLLNIFRQKAYAAQGLHCQAPARIAGKKIGDWLTPGELEGEGGETFIEALGNSRAWIRRGDDWDKSRLIKECEWGGRMFGAFTNNEVAVMKAWARALPTESEALKPMEDSMVLFSKLTEPYLRLLAGSDNESYERGVKAREYFDSTILPCDFTELVSNIANREQWERSATAVLDQTLAHPHGIRGIFEGSTQEFLWRLLPSDIEQKVSSEIVGQILADVKSHSTRNFTTEDKDDILPTLFVAPALLEYLPSASPAKLAGPLGMAVVRIQRCLLGFKSPEDVEGAGCAGLDDVREVQDGLWELACQISKQGDETALDSLRAYAPRALALPALIYLLNSQPTLNLPVILGLQLGINLMLTEPLCRAEWAPNAEWTDRMRQITDLSRFWLVDGIRIGAEGVNTRGWEGSGDWSENVWLGYLIAREFISKE